MSTENDNHTYFEQLDSLFNSFKRWRATDFSPGDFAIRRGRRPSQTGRMTIKKLKALIVAGCGQGHFQRYKPWLSVTKRDYSPTSNMGHLPAPELARFHHYRALAERNTILLAKWLGAVDAREAYPVWPWAHAHPGEGLPNFPNFSQMPGLVEIAEATGIQHGVYPGTNLPYVATFDVLTTWELPDGSFQLVALENKPWETVYAPSLVSRAKERLELTRRYCASAQIRQVIVHAENFPNLLGTNLDHFDPNLTKVDQKNLRGSPTYRALVEYLAMAAYSRPIGEVVREFASRVEKPVNSLWPLVRLAIWHQDVDHDITRCFNTWCPLIAGGRDFRAALWRDWLGVSS